MDTILEPDHERRFGGLNRLYGSQALDILGKATVVIVGVGGVGSWAVEALARSAVGHLVLIDMDHVAESNINRQIQATSLTLGHSKGGALQDRIATYAPACKVSLVDDFLTPENAVELLSSHTQGRHAIILDCCDQSAAKIAMARYSRRHKVPLAMAGSAGGKTRPWLIQVADLRDTTNDALLSKVRYILRKQHGFSKSAKMAVPVFFSPEQAVKTEACDAQAGLNCAGYGSAVSVTATMGMQMAGWAINRLMGFPVG